MAKKQDDNENLKKKLAADGGSQPFKVELIRIHKDFNSKLNYFIRILNAYYEQNPNFYLQRHEFSGLKDLLSKDSVWCVNANMFEYQGKKYATTNIIFETEYSGLLRSNRIFIFHGIGRGDGKYGDLVISGVYI